MRTIWKFEFDIADAVTIMMPRNADVISAAQVQATGARAAIWALVEDTAEKEPRVIRVVGTGHPAPAAVGPSDLIATIVMSGSYTGLVFHVFADPLDRGVMTKELPAQHRAITRTKVLAND
jgi:hypothetical protein